MALLMGKVQVMATIADPPPAAYSRQPRSLLPSPCMLPTSCMGIVATAAAAVKISLPLS